jgi:hypothetical protein
VPYSESPRNKSPIAPILIKIGRDLTCFRPVQSLDLLGWGSHVLRVLSKIAKKRGVTHVLRVLSKIEFCALAPDFFIINFRLQYGNMWFANCKKHMIYSGHVFLYFSVFVLYIIRLFSVAFVHACFWGYISVFSMHSLYFCVFYIVCIWFVFVPYFPYVLSIFAVFVGLVVFFYMLNVCLRCFTYFCSVVRISSLDFPYVVRICVVVVPYMFRICSVCFPYLFRRFSVLCCL